MKRALLMVFILSFVPASFAQDPLDQPLDNFFVTEHLPDDWKESASVLSGEMKEGDAAQATAITNALKRVEEDHKLGNKKWGMVPGILNVVAHASGTHRTAALQTLRAVFLADKRIDVNTKRIAKELTKILKGEKDPAVKSAILKTIAHTGDPESVLIFVEALEAQPETKDKELLANIDEYRHRIGVNAMADVPIEGFQKLEKKLSETFGGDRIASDVRDIYLREVAKRKLRANKLNDIKSAPTFPPKAGMHKTKK